MIAYITAQDDLVITNSKAKKSIEAGNLDKMRVPWFKLSKVGTLWQLEEFDGEEVRVVAKTGTPRKLLVPLQRKGGSIYPDNVYTFEKWLDIQAGLSR